MKLKTLTLHNIASIPDATINFDADPLASTDVFLISGKTGSGKSTILDAICLALYDQMPRFTNTFADNVPEEIKLKTNDARQILRRNTGEGFILLTFQGNNGHDYEASWSISRANKNPSKGLQNRVWTLKNLNQNRIISTDKKTKNATELKDEINACIGLDFNQFCRTSMLAQGEFSKFLNSNDDDKSKILENLIGEDIYSKIGKKIFEITSEKSSHLKETQIKIGSIKLLNEEDIALKSERVEFLNSQFAEITNNLESLNFKKNWLSNLSFLEKNLEEATKKKQIAEEKSQNPDFLQKKELAEDWNKTTDPRGWINKIAENFNMKTIQENNLEDLQQVYLKFLSGIIFEENSMIKIDNQLEELQKYFAKEEPRKETLSKKDSIVILLKNLVTNKKAIDDEEENKRILNKKLNDNLIIEKGKTSERLKKIQTVIDHETQYIENEDRELQKIGLDQLRSQKEEIANTISSINITVEKLKNFLRDKNNLASDKQRLCDMMQEVTKKQKHLSELKKTLDGAISKEKNSRLIYESQKDTIDKFAKNLRSRLHVGDDCPVCRQKIQKVFLPEDELDALILSYKNEWEVAKKKLDETQQLYNLKEVELRAFNGQITELKNSLEKLEKELLFKEMEISGSLDVFGLKEVSEKEMENLTNQVNLKKDEELNLRQSIKDGEKREADLKEKREGLTKLQKEEKETGKELQRHKDEIVQCNIGIENSDRIIKGKKEDNIKTEQELEKLIKGKWKSDWKSDYNGFLTELNEVVETYKSNESIKNNLEGKKTDIKVTYEDVVADKKRILEIIPSWNELAKPSIGIQMQNIIHIGNKLISDVSAISTSIKSLLDENEKIQKNLEVYLANESKFDMSKLENLAKISSGYIEKLNEEIKNVENNLLIVRTSWSDAKNSLEEHKKGKPELKEDETIETIQEVIRQLEERRNSTLTEKGSVDQELRENAKKQKEFEAVKMEIEQKRLEHEKWQNLNRYLGDKEGKTFRTIALSYVLESLIHSANRYMSTLSDRYRLKINPGSFVILVEDHYQEDITRAASTLSGGETFLVSLSLALALSDIGDRIGTDILFIDEGFGTLSGEPLESAIETLRSLHTKTGRHVGIISHIEELQERIPVKILVKQGGVSSASQIDVVPKS